MITLRLISLSKRSISCQAIRTHGYDISIHVHFRMFSLIIPHFRRVYYRHMYRHTWWHPCQRDPPLHARRRTSSRLGDGRARQRRAGGGFNVFAMAIALLRRLQPKEVRSTQQRARSKGIDRVIGAVEWEWDGFDGMRGESAMDMNDGNGYMCVIIWYNDYTSI